MCGIAGFVGEFPPELLDRMNRAQAHRGPDDAGTLSLPSVGLGLGHRRLSIIDLSPDGHQPMWDRSGAVAIVFNGEIYNYRELRSDLLRGYSFRSRSDTEVLLALYLDLGHEMLQKLNGIFAFAIWDSRTSELFVARDGFGVKPLYYSEAPNGFLFASEIKAILEADIDRTLDPSAIRDYLTYLWCPAPRTMLRSVRKLEPGCAMVVHEARIRRTWRFYDAPIALEAEMMSEADAISQVRFQLERAVSRQLVADVPVGAFLSGGLDSSSIVALARHLQPGTPIECFTIASARSEDAGEGFAEDLPHAMRVAQHLEVDLHVAHIDSAMAPSLAEAVFHLDEPQADFAAINTLIVAQLARQHGIKVLLSGVGGDDLFSGYRRHRAMDLERFWGWSPGPTRRLLQAAARRLPTRSPTLRRVGKAFEYAGLDADERVASYFHWLRPEERLRLEGPLLAEAPEDEAGFSPSLLHSLSQLPPSLTPLGKMLYLESRHYLPDHNLSYTDKMAMAAGVEVRVPFLDLDVASLAAQIPLAMRQRGRTGKWVLRKAMEPLLPTGIVERTKVGFGAPIRSWLRGDWRELVDDLLSVSSLDRRGVFSGGAVQDLISRDRKGQVDAAYPILSLLCIELWCQQFLD